MHGRSRQIDPLKSRAAERRRRASVRRASGYKWRKPFRIRESHDEEDGSHRRQRCV